MELVTPPSAQTDVGQVEESSSAPSLGLLGKHEYLLSVLASSRVVLAAVLVGMVALLEACVEVEGARVDLVEYRACLVVFGRMMRAVHYLSVDDVVVVGQMLLDDSSPAEVHSAWDSALAVYVTD